MRSRKYNQQILLGTFVIFAFHFAFFFTGIFHLTLKSMLSTDGFLFILFFLGTLIISPYLDKNSGHLVKPFFILTFVQLLAVIFIVILYNVTKIHNAKVVSFHLLTIFICLILLKSFVFVRGKNIYKSDKQLNKKD